MVAQLDQESMEFVVHGPKYRSGGLIGCEFRPRVGSYAHDMHFMLDHARRPENNKQLEGWDICMLRDDNSVVRLHPETSRPALYVNADYTQHFEGMTQEESRPLLEFLYAWASRPEYRWRHQWRVGDLVMWDNASVQHSVIPDVEKGARLLHRVTLEGEAPN